MPTPLHDGVEVLKIASNAKKLLSVDRAPAKEDAAKRREMFRGVAFPVCSRFRGHHTAHDMEVKGSLSLTKAFPLSDNLKRFNNL